MQEIVILFILLVLGAVVAAVVIALMILSRKGGRVADLEAENERLRTELARKRETPR
ncbi:MAG: hypothetical protein ACRC33_21580 [Gemmataceae bacterium]